MRPPEVDYNELELVATVPAELAVQDRAPGWERSSSNAPIAFLEGPTLTEDGGLYLVDVAWGRILRLRADGHFSVVLEYDGEPNGLILLDDGDLMVADYQRGLLRIQDPDSTDPHVTCIATDVGGTPFLGLNDLTPGLSGSIFVTDQGDSGLHDPSGRVLRWNGDELDVVLDGLPSPNGLAWHDATTTLYVAMTRDNAVWRIPLADGKLGRVGRFLQLSGGIGPDGLSLGPHDSLLVAHLGSGRVLVYDAAGLLAAVLISPMGPAVTNLCVDPKGHLWVTESSTGSVLTYDLRLLEPRLVRATR